jgi:2-polyprenyl-3-methyl-5-hydroxy-6-metoxy-1,4-benzoquinol methylase
MIKTESIKKELILPDAIALWERNCCGSVLLAKVFKFWRYRHLAIALCVGILLSLINFSIGICLISLFFLLDYFILRSRAKEKAQVQLFDLKKLMRNGFYESDKLREDSYEFDIGKNKLLDSNPANILRKSWISKVAEHYFRSYFLILDAGCKGGEISAPLSRSCASIFGLDFNRSAIKNFIKRFNWPGVQANILDLPFKSNKFDAALCTEVIEHLFNPIQGLNEIANVLKQEGLLIVSTDNRNHIKLMDMLNPIIIIERLIGLVSPRVLIPKNLIWSWKERFKIYHTEYSRAELVSLVKATNQLEIVSFFSSSFLPGFHKLICRVFSNLSQDDYIKIIFPIEKILAKIPVIKCLGDHWIIILRKI